VKEIFQKDMQVSTIGKSESSLCAVIYYLKDCVEREGCARDRILLMERRLKGNVVGI